jgi:hypothetical protein
MLAKDAQRIEMSAGVLSTKGKGKVVMVAWLMVLVGWWAVVLTFVCV